MIEQLLQFLRHPTDHFAARTSPRTCVRALLVLLAFDLLITFALGAIIGLLDDAGLFDLGNHAVADALTEYSPGQLLLIAVVGTPLAEELIFRLPLRYRTNPVVGLARVFTPTTTEEVDARLAADLRGTWDRCFPYTFYGLTAAFALVHLLNYGGWTTGLLLFSPLLVAPQFVTGALTGFLRVQYGFVWAVVLHALHNLVLVMAVV